MGALMRGVALAALLVAPAGATTPAADSLDTTPVPADPADVRAVVERHADGWWRRHARFGVLAIAGTDTLVEVFAGAGPAAGALRADTRARAGWVSLRLRSWRLVAGGVRASFGAGAVLGRTGSALARPLSPPRGRLVRVSPSTSLWRPVRGAALSGEAGRFTVAAIAWEGEERAAAVAVSLEQPQWRAGVMAGRVQAGRLDEPIASFALGIRSSGHAALVEAGLRAGALHAVVRASAGRSPRWTAELATSIAGTAFGAPLASSATAGRRRLRMAVARSGRLGPVGVRAAVWSVTDREIDATRRQRRYEVEVRARLPGATLRAALRLHHDHTTEWFAADPVARAGELRYLRASAGCESRVNGARQFVRVTMMLGPASGRGTMLQWGASWSGRRARLDARMTAAALAPGQKGWFARPAIGGRETLGVATGAVSDVALRAGVHLRGVTLSGWVGAGSRRGVRAYIGIRAGD